MKRLKRWICCGVALTLAAGLFSGCGQKETNGSGGENAPGRDTAETPEYVYVAEYIPVERFGDGRNSIQGATWIDGSFYATAYEMVADNTPEGVTPEYEGQYWEYAPFTYRIGLDGKAEKLAYQPEMPELNEGEEGNTYLQDFAPLADGSIAVLEQTYRYWFDLPEGMTREEDGAWEYYHNRRSYAVKTIDHDGTIIASTDLSMISAGIGEGEEFYVNSFCADREGNLYLTRDQTIYVMDTAGAVQFTIEGDVWVDNMFRLADGSVGCVYYGESGPEFARIDLETKSFGEGRPFRGDSYSMSAGGGDYALYYTNGIYFYGYDPETGETEKILNWIDCDVDPDGGSRAAVLDDGRIVVPYTEWDTNYEVPENSLIVLTQKPWDSVPHKEVLTLATLSLDYDIRGKVIEFNRKNEKYRIEVRDYSEYNNYTEDMADYTAGLTKLKTEIGAGTLPDLLDMNGLPLEQMAAKGMIEDLYPWLDSDPSLNRSDFLPSVLSALEVGGKLYTTCPTFSIWTAIGAASVVGDTPGWTYDEFNAALRSMPEGCTAFDQYVTRDDMLRTCLALDGDSFVNWATGECTFDSDAFVKLLEFVKSFPDEFDWENYRWTEEDSTPNRVASGRQMLLQQHISDFDELQMFQAMFGGDATYVGFPSETGTGNMIQPHGCSYAITSKCANKEAAWEFLRMFFTADYSSRYGWGLPIHKAAFDKKLEEAMTPEYQKDADGNFVLDENGERIEISRGGWSWGSLEVEFHAMTQAEADKLIEAVNTTTKLYKADDSIYEIVSEQAAAFFTGQKSAQDVARLVQSKAMIYVNEQR